MESLGTPITSTTDNDRTELGVNIVTPAEDNRTRVQDEDSVIERTNTADTDVTVIQDAIEDFENYTFDPFGERARAAEDESIAAALMMFNPATTTVELPRLRTEPWPYGGQRPDPINIGTAKKLLGAAYAEITCELEAAGDHGYAWIIEDESDWLTREGVAKIEAPTKPKEVMNFDMKAQWEFAVLSRRYKVYKHLAQEGRRKIMEWFGQEMFHDLFKNGALPPHVTPKDLLKHIEDTYATPNANRMCMERVEEEINGPYDPKKPVEAYFKVMQDARVHSAMLGVEYTTEQLINKALKQFELQYGRDAFKAEKKWNERESTEQTWEAFKVFWREEIQQLSIYASRGGKTKRANHAVDIESLMENVSALRAETETLKEHNDNLTAQLNFQHAQAYQTSSRNSSDDTTISTLTDQIIDGLASRIGNITIPTHGDSRRDEILHTARNRNAGDFRNLNGGKGKRYSSYCWKCGCNCTHWTKRCLELTANERKKYRDADFDNLMGGSTTNLDRALPHSRPPDQPPEGADDITVVTSNTSSTTSSSASWTTVDSGRTRTVCDALAASAPTSVVTSNFYDALLDDDTDDPEDYDHTSIAIDSGASDNFGDVTTTGTNRRATSSPVIMASATGDRRTSIGKDSFNLPLPAKSLDFHVFPEGDVQRPLLSVGKVCDTGCDVLFTAKRCYIFKDRRLLLKTKRDPTTGLYLIPRQRWNTPAQEFGFNLSQPYRQRAHDGFTIPNLMSYLHACAGYPVTGQWIQAIRLGYYMGWPGLTASRVHRYLPKSEETALGHLKLIRQGIRSTRQVSREIGRRRKVMVGAMDTDDLTGVMGTDQTGRFPTTSDRDHKYIFLLFDEDINYIYAVPIKSKKTGELIRAFRESYETLAKCGFEPILHRIDNETSDALFEAITTKGLTYETVPPGNHRRNPAERAIQTFKSHFIAILNGVDENYPPGAWDYLIPQTNLTLNLMRPCTVNDAHSAHSYVHGPYDFNAHPLAPLGCRAIVHQRAIGSGGKRTTWENRGKVGYYIGPALDSYRVWKFFIPETKGIQETDTAVFFPRTPLPTTTVETEIIESLDRIEQTLEEARPTHSSTVCNEEGPCSVIRRLRAMYRPEDSGEEDARAPRVPKETASPPRVQKPRAKINAPRPKQKQRYPLGTKVRVTEKQDGKRVVFIGEATEYDPHTGMYKVVFEDGEWDEFNDDEMGFYRMIKTKATANKPTTYANQLVVHGFFPKAGPATTCVHGLNAGSIYDEELQKWMAYRDLIKHPNPKIRRRWEQAGMNEFARLAQGLGDVKGMDVVTFIAASELPKDKKATYARYVVDYRPEKDEPWRLRITCGGDKLEYLGNTTTHSATMETIKCQLNSIVSTPNAKAATGDISNMYLGSDLPEAEFVRFRLDLIPTAFIEAYGLQKLVTPNGFIYARVNKAWYGLKQAGKIAHDDLVERLADAGYRKADLVEGYFAHESRPISFTLVVDDFLIKYINSEDLEHLREAIGKHYTFKVDEDAKQYVGIHLKWDYDKRTVRLSMDGYVKQALLEFQHEAPSRTYYGPSQYTPPQYGAKVQFAKVDNTALLEDTKVTFIQKVVGKLLYYARAVDPTMLHAINDISLSASKGTEATLRATMHLLNYAATYPDTEIIYRASDMILRVDSDAAYLVAPEARSRAGGYQYLSNAAGTLFNGPVLVLAKVIKNVMASAAEAEIAALFMNGQEAVALRNCLEAMGFPQPATPMKTDNSTASGIMNNTMKQKRSKAIDVRFYWLRDRAQQGQFYIFWESGAHNLADYHTKHHPPGYYKTMRPIQSYVHGVSPDSLQGCIEMMGEVQTGSKALSLLAQKLHLNAQDGW